MEFEPKHILDQVVAVSANLFSMIVVTEDGGFWMCDCNWHKHGDDITAPSHALVRIGDRQRGFSLSAFVREEDPDNILTTMPNLINMSVAEARRILSELSVTLDIVEREQADDEIRARNIADTLPATGAELRDGQQVVLFVSTGPTQQMVTVPNVIGSTLNDATRALQNAQIDFNVNQEHHPTVPQGQVISQSIQPGTSVVAGEATVVLVISLGPAPEAPPPPPPEPPPAPPEPPGDENGEGE